MSSPGFSSYAAAAGLGGVEGLKAPAQSLPAAALIRGNESTYPPRNESRRGLLIQTVGRGHLQKNKIRKANCRRFTVNLSHLHLYSSDGDLMVYIRVSIVYID
jgi:hypothetical protein